MHNSGLDGEGRRVTELSIFSVLGVGYWVQFAEPSEQAWLVDGNETRH